MKTRIKASLLLAFKAVIVGWKQLLLVYAIFPICIAASIGYFENDIYEAQPQIDKINISIVDKDGTNSSRGFKELFNSTKVRKVFNVLAKGDYVITIPKGYEDNILNLKKDNITIAENKDVSRQNKEVIKALIEAYGRVITREAYIHKDMSKLNSKDKMNLYSTIAKKISEETSKPLIKDNIIKAKKTINSSENTAFSLIAYMVVAVIMGCNAAHHRDKENGTFKRLISSPIKKEAYFNLDILCFFVQSVAFGIIYVAAFIISGFAFRDANILLLLLIVLVQAAVISSFSGLFMAFFNKAVANIILMFFLYYEVIFGGAFIPSSEISNSTYIFLEHIAPGNIISEAYRNCVIYKSFSSIEINLIIMLAASILAYSISYIKVKIRWEEN